MTGRLTVKGFHALPLKVVDAIEAAVPDDHTIEVKRTDAWWLIYLHGANGGRVTPGPLRVSRGMRLEDALRFALDRWTGVTL